jgi:16S rRNA (guanine(966)-N(2))-methyltransferase RsmD
VLAPRIEGAFFVDLYAGSGAVGIEALSRGARQAVFVERAEHALKAIRANVAALGIRGGYALEPRSAAAALKQLVSSGRTADIVFLDPPYASVDEYEIGLGLLGGECSQLLAENAVVITESSKRHNLAERYGELVRYRVLKQGDAALSFYRLEPTSQI